MIKNLRSLEFYISSEFPLQFLKIVQSKYMSMYLFSRNLKISKQNTSPSLLQPHCLLVSQTNSHKQSFEKSIVFSEKRVLSCYKLCFKYINKNDQHQILTSPRWPFGCKKTASFRIFCPDSKLNPI